MKHTILYGLKKNTNKIDAFSNKFHIVGDSILPFLISLCIGNLFWSVVVYMHSEFALESFNLTKFEWIFWVLLLTLTICSWASVTWDDANWHLTEKDYKGLRMGIILVITSEVLFFFGFFWSFFYLSIAPSYSLGCIWPPKGIDIMDPAGIPLLNTILLLSSGFFLVYCHRAIIDGKKKEIIWSLWTTLFLAILFIELQLYEYKHATFSINDSVYSSLFFLTTGFHGLHVIIGTILLFISLFTLESGYKFTFWGSNKNYRQNITPIRHVGFEGAAWYWHFVDVVWIFLYISVYCWGGLI